MNFKSKTIEDIRENYKRITNPTKMLNEVGFDQYGNPMGFNKDEEDNMDYEVPESTRPKKGDFIILKSAKYPEYTYKVISLGDATHVEMLGLENGQPMNTRGSILHVGQLRGRSYYDAVENWLMGKGEPEQATYGDL